MTRTATGAAAGPVMEGHHQMPVLLSVNVGLPANVTWRGKTVYTGIWKHPVHGPAMVRRLNIDGDGQGDLNGHGGEQRAVLAYQIQAYQHWQRNFGREDFSYGTFGEDLTVDGLPDDEVCIGDRYRIGEAEFEVTAPFAADRRSVLDLPDACDVPTCWSCRTGVCHTCITPLLSGGITYAPAPLEPPADGQVLICCARPSTDIVLGCKAWMRHEQADPARCAASVHRMPSAEGTKARPDVFAVSPAIGPLPAIDASSSPSQATVPGLLRHATVRAARRAGGWAVRHLSRHGKYCQGGS